MNNLTTTMEDIAAHIQAGKIIFAPSHAPAVIVPEGFTLKDIEYLRDRPARIREHAKIATAQSFIDYVRMHSTQTSILLADEEARRIRALIDYHDDEANHKDHTATYTCKLSKEWREWSAADNKRLNQLQFAEFIEDHVNDITDPVGAELLDMTNRFHVVRNSVFGSVQRLATGEFSIQYSQENQKGSIEFPETITLAIAPFHAGERYELKARVRYRVDDGKLALWYQLISPEKVLEHAFSEVKAAISTALSGLPMLDGDI